MEIRFSGKNRAPMMAAMFALLLLGAGSLLLTWQSIRRQEGLTREQMILAGKMLIRGVEANLVHDSQRFRKQGLPISMFSPIARNFFPALAREKAVLFFGLYGPEGRLLISSSDKNDPVMPQLPAAALRAIRRKGQWHTLEEYKGKETLVMGLAASPGTVRLWLGVPDEDEISHPREDLTLVAGLDVDRNLSQLKEYRRAAFIQTGYVLGAAVFLWSLAFGYFRRRDQDKRLVQLERFQSKLLDNTPDGLLTVGQDNTILSANGSALELLGGTRGELVGTEWTAFPFGRPDKEASWVHRDYRDRRLEMLSLPLQNPSGQEDGLERMVIIRDRTEIRGLEDDLNEARKLAAIGSLAAGVAHEIRNPLSSLRGFAQFFAEKLKGEEPMESYAVTMVHEADRLNRVVTDLLYLAKPKPPDIRPLHAAELAEDLERLLRFDMSHKDITFSTDLEIPIIHADPDGIRQVLLNVLVNSMDALTDTGGAIIMAVRPDEEGCWVEVADNGPGMPEDIQKQALEPFFTAKKTGTGLGLAIVQSLMRAHKGRIRIISEPDNGTTVRLFFPGPDSNRENDSTLTSSGKNT